MERFSMPPISAPSLSARGTPRRLMPTSPRSSAPLFFSMISWARRTSVRSISEADMIRPFSRNFGAVFFSDILWLLPDDTGTGAVGQVSPKQLRTALSTGAQRCDARANGAAGGSEQDHSKRGNGRGAEDDRRRALWREPEVGKLGHRGCRLRIGMGSLTRELLRDRMELLVEFTAVLRASLNYRFQTVNCRRKKGGQHSQKSANAPPHAVGGWHADASAVERNGGYASADHPERTEIEDCGEQAHRDGDHECHDESAQNCRFP